MSNVLQLFPARVAIGQAKDGTLIYASAEFLKALQKLFERVGGATGPSTTDLNISDDEDSGLEEFKLEQWKTNDACDMRPLPVFDTPDDPQLPTVVCQEFTDPMHPIQQEHVAVQALLTELAGLREEVAALRSQVEGIMQGTDL